MNLGENIKNAFGVVQKTYENVDKLIKYCDLISEDYGYESVTNKLLRFRSDVNHEGWSINSFIKLYQSKGDKSLSNGWKDGAVFVMEINFQDIPTVYISKFEYEDISTWDRGVSPREHWRFTEPIDCEGNGFNESVIEEKENYFLSEPTADIKARYWDIKNVIYTKIDLLEIDSDNVHQRVFGEFDVLKKIFK